MKIRTIASLFAVILSVQPAISFAGAGANVYFCFDSPNTPIMPVKVNVYNFLIVV